MRMLGILVVSGLVLGFGAVHGSDVNWGKKVPCFFVDGTVVCPGCNYRAGLSCPRGLKNSQNCLTPSTEAPKIYSTKSTPKKPYQEDKKFVTESKEASSFENTSTAYLDASTKIMPVNTSTPKPTTNMDLALFLYKAFGEQANGPRYRYSRDVKPKVLAIEENETEEEQICNWNADCPCPQICCKTGPGCPKRCVMGIRLPPPWGR